MFNQSLWQISCSDLRSSYESYGLHSLQVILVMAFERFRTFGHLNIVHSVIWFDAELIQHSVATTFVAVTVNCDRNGNGNDNFMQAVKWRWLTAPRNRAPHLKALSIKILLKWHNMAPNPDHR